jgi:hypothetical protein
MIVDHRANLPDGARVVPTRSGRTGWQRFAWVTVRQYPIAQNLCDWWPYASTALCVRNPARPSPQMPDARPQTGGRPFRIQPRPASDIHVIHPFIKSQLSEFLISPGKVECRFMPFIFIFPEWEGGPTKKVPWNSESPHGYWG